MPFAARVGFFTVSGAEPPAPTDPYWYEYDRTTYETVSVNLTGGTVVNGTFEIAGLNSSLGYRSSVAHPNGNIYCMPRNTGNGMLEIDPVNQTYSTHTYGALGLLSASGQAYFHSACLTESGNILAVPFNYDYIVQVDPVAQTATKFGTGGRDSGPFTGSVQFTGAVLCPNGNVIACPQQYGNFLDIDPVNETVTVTNFGLTLRSGTNEFFGGTRSFLDDKIYPSPLRYQGIVAIDSAAKTATSSTYSQSWPGTNNHYGACCDKFGRVIYMQGENTVPNRIYNPDTDTATTFTLSQNNFGAVQGADGNVYTISKGSQGKKIAFTSNTDNTPTITTTYINTGNKMMGATALNGNTYIMSDQGDATVFEIDTQANTSINNFSNVVMTTFINSGRI